MHWPGPPQIAVHWLSLEQRGLQHDVSETSLSHFGVGTPAVATVFCAQPPAAGAACGRDEETV